MENEKLLSVSEYAARIGISKQAVYKQLNNKLKDYSTKVDGKIYIYERAFTELFENGETTTVEQQVEQLFNQVEQPVESAFLKEQIKIKDNEIEKLLQQIENLQQQNSKLTDLLNNSQILLAAEKQLQIESPREKPEKKKLFSFLKKK